MASNANSFVADTHALWWYLRSPELLSPAASAVFRLAESGNALIIVPAIVVAEVYYLSVKLGQALTPATLFDALTGREDIQLSSLGRSQLEKLSLFPEIPEMHDRLIAAESVSLDAPVITRDETLSTSPKIDTIW